MDPRSILELLEHTPVRAYLFDARSGDDFTLVGANACARHNQPAIVAMCGRSMGFLYEDQPQMNEDATRCVRERATVVREMNVRSFTQAEAKQLLRLTYVFVPDDHLVVYAQDISPPDLAQEVLRASEDRYRGLVSAMPDAVILRKRDGTVLTCNDAGVRLLGYASAGEVIGQTRVVPMGYHVEDEEGHVIPVDEMPSGHVLRTGAPIVGKVYAQVAADGERRWARVSSQPIRDAGGEITSVVTTYTDVTDRIVAQHALRESAARLDLALDAARMGTWEWDTSSPRGTWSENLYRLFDVPGPEGSDVAASIHKEDLDAVRKRLAAFVPTAEDGALFESECRIVGRDKRTRWARFSGRISRDKGRARMVGTVMDTTERRRLESELLRANRLESLGRLAGGVAHDFNNLLAAMFGSLELALAQAPPAVAEDLMTIRHAAERARDLTRQLLAFARRQPLQPKVLDLSRLVDDVERILRRLVGSGVELVVEHDGPLHVRADAAQVEQVIVNLIVNARDATPAGGRVTLHLRETELTEPSGEVPAGVYAELEVRDTGAGMDEETLRQAFDPFFTTKSEGTGLGLASCYGIVRQHDGHILVESTPDRGTRFRVLLPRAAAVTETPAPGAVASPKSSGRVLLVEDEPLVRATAARLLRSLGYEVLTASGGAEALVRSANEPGHIDVLVCDVMMPDKTGPEVARDLALLRPSMKVLFVSGYPADAIQKGLEGVSFLQKPYSRSDLAAKLDALRGT